MPMKICIDVRPLQNAHRTRGVGVLLHNLLRQMGRLAVEDDVTLITLKGKAFPPLFRHERRLETRRLERPNRFNWIADQFLLPELVKKSGAELFFATDFNSYLVPTGNLRVVSMVYDLIPFVFPEAMAAQPLSVKIGWRTNFKKLRYSQGLIAISEATKRDLVSLLGVAPEKIAVIHPGIDHTLFNPDNAGDGERRLEVLARYGIEGCFLLYVGDSEWRKNLRRVLEALSGIDSDLRIVLAGKRALTDATLHGWVRELGLQERVVIPGYVPDADLPLLYGAAQAFVFPTLYEGFGFPVVQAMGCGCPVITSKVSSLPEVAGDAALLADPLSVAEIRKALELVSGDADLRQRMSSAGLRQASLFSWERCAAETLAFLRATAGGL